MKKALQFSGAGYLMVRFLEPQMSTDLKERAARAAHEANRVYCTSINDFSQRSWDTAPEWQRASARNGVEMIAQKPGVKPADLHASWMKAKEDLGWSFGPVKDPDAKTHPCMVPYENLPIEQKLKDDLFGSVVRAVLFG